MAYPQPIDIKKLTKELLKSLRGKLSQQDINQSFEFSFNQAYRWEAGITKISWDEFVDYCQHSGHLQQLQKSLEKVDRVSLANDAKNISGFFTAQLGNKNIVAYSKKIKIPRKTFAKWLKADIYPSLEQMLNFFHYEVGTLVPFCADLTDISALSSLKDTYRRYKIREGITLKYPMVSLVLNYLHTEEYKSLIRVTEGHFCRLFGMSMQVEKEIFEALENSLTIEKKNNKWHMTSYDVFRVVGAPEDIVRRYEFYLGLLADYIRKNNMEKGRTQFRHIIFSTNPATRTKIEAVMSKAHVDVADILDEAGADKNCTDVSVLVSGMVHLKV